MSITPVSNVLAPSSDSFQNLQTKLQELRAKNNPLIRYADDWFNLKGNVPGASLLSESLQWQIYHAALAKRRSAFEIDLGENFYFKHLDPADLSQLYRILNSYHSKAEGHSSDALYGAHVQALENYSVDLCKSNSEKALEIEKALRKIQDANLNGLIHKVGLELCFTLAKPALEACELHPVNPQTPKQDPVLTAADTVGDSEDRFVSSLEPTSPKVPTQAWSYRFPATHTGVYCNTDVVHQVGNQKIDFYAWSPPLALIRLPNKKIWKLIPEKLKSYLLSQGATEAIFENSKNTNCFLNLSGNPFYEMGPDAKTYTCPAGYNISFHSSVLPLDSKGEEINAHVGVYASEGIESMDVPVEKLEARIVCLHTDNSRASSPNNIKFKLISPVASFWSIAAHKGRFALAFHVMLNEDGLEKQVRAACRRSHHLVELLQELKTTPLPEPIKGKIEAIMHASL